MWIKSTLTVLVCAVFIFQACKKNVAGPQGDPGINGKNGNSNISSTVSFALDSTSWLKVPSGDIENWVASVAVQEITQNAIKNGMITVYVFDNNVWWPLPYSEGLLITQCKYTEGSVYFSNSDMHNQIPARPKTRNYRVVVQETKL